MATVTTAPRWFSSARLAALLLLGGAGLTGGCTPNVPAQAQTEPDLHDEARARGVDYINRSGSAGKPYILEANGAGVALFDLGADGDLDLAFAQGLARTEDLLEPALGTDIVLYENDGRGHFQRLPGPGLRGWWTGLVSGDLDNDGDDDLVVGGFGSSVVLLQEQAGDQAAPEPAVLVRATELTPPSTTQTAPPWTTSLAVLDANRDGVLDLYVTQYLDLDPRRLPQGSLGKAPLDVPCEWKGAAVYCGPLGLNAQTDRLLLGRGDGSFVDASERLQGLVPAFGLGVHAFDADQDGDDDIFVANDSQPNFLWINDGTGTFVDGALALGVAYGAEGRAQAGMGVASGDVNRDGALDLVVTNFSDEPTEMYAGGARGFTRLTHRYALGRETRALLSWGCHLMDFDGDGWLELVSVNGHVYPQADLPDTGTRYGQPVTRWALGPQPKAVLLPPRAKDSLFAPAVGGRGSAVGDLNQDGRPDLVVVRIDAPASVGMNTEGTEHARLSVRLLGPDQAVANPQSGTTPRRTPRDGSGATCIVVVKDTAGAEHALLAETRRAVGFQSSSTPWLHFGLGTATRYEALIIRWPSGAVERLPGGPANRALTVREGSGILDTRPFQAP